MFFSEEEIEKFPEEIRKKIYDLEVKDKEIYQLNKKGKNIDLKVINFTTDSLKLFLESEKKLNDEQKKLMTEAIGNIPITFFILDKLKINKKVKEILHPLTDIIDAHASLDINRKKLILEVLKKLEEFEKKRK